MADRVIRFFVSSSMSELPDERRAVKSAIEGLEFGTFLYEDNANAGVEPPKEQWEKELAEANVVLVILFRKLGKWTLAEIDFAGKAKAPILYYRKRDPEDRPEPELVEFLAVIEDVETGRSVRYFAEAAELETIVPKDVNDLLAGLLERLAKFEKGEIQGQRRKGGAGDDGAELDEAARPGVRRIRAAEIRSVDDPPPVFVGRDAAAKALLDSIEADERMVPITGVYGIGRKALARHVVHAGTSNLAERFPHRVGASPLHEGTREAEDMLQALWELFYELEEGADPATVVTPRKRRRDLEEVRSLVVIEDPALTQAELVNEVGKQMRKSTVVVTVRSWQGQSVALESLKDFGHQLEVFAAKYRRPIPEAAHDRLSQLFTQRLGGSPFLIEALAGMASSDIPLEAEADVLAQWADAIEALDQEDLRKALVPEEAQAAFEAVQAVQAPVPFKVLGRIPGGAASASAGVRNEKLKAASPRLRVDPALTDAVGAPRDDQALLGQMFDAALGWAEEAAPDEIFENREFVLRMLDWGAGQGRSADVIRLARSTEHAVAVGGRHGAWRGVLTAALDAARSSEPPDLETEAWALHQLGSMALLRDELDDARELLHDALERREALGDEAAARVSRHNLGLIPMAIVSVATLVLLLLGLTGWFAALASAGGWAREPGSGGSTTTTTTRPTSTTGGTTTSTPTTVTPPPAVFVLDVSANPAEVVPGGMVRLAATVTNSSDAPLTMTALDVSVDGPAEEVPLGACDEELVTVDPGRAVTCTIETVVLGAPGEEVVFTVTAEADGETGDSEVRSVTVPIVAPLTVTLAALPDRVQPGASVDFTVAATPATDLTIVAVTADGGGLADVSAVDGCEIGVLLAGGSAAYTCAFTGSVAGSPGDTATVTVDIAYVLPDGTELVAAGMADLEVIEPAAAAVSVQASWRLTFDADGDGSADAGDDVTFDYTIANGGGVPLTDLGVTDSLSAAVVTPFESLAPGRSVSLSTVHEVTQAEFDAGTLVNTVTVTASADGQEVAPAEDTVVVPLAAQEPAVRAQVVAGIVAGDISYAATLENVGNVTLSGARLTTGRAGVVCDLSGLAPGTSTACPTASYRPSSADLSVARVTDSATVRATGPGGVVIEHDTTITVTFGVLEVAVDVVTTPAGSSFTVVFADQPWQLGPGAVEQAAVAGTAGTETITVSLPDDWTLSSASCAAISPIPGPAIGTVEVPVAPGSTVSCTLQISGAGVIEIDPNVLRFPPNSFTITNVGTATVTVPPHAPDPAAGFATDGGCDGATLEPRDSCTVTVTADPGALGIIDFDFGPGVSGDTRVLLIGP